MARKDVVRAVTDEIRCAIDDEVLRLDGFLDPEEAYLAAQATYDLLVDASRKVAKIRAEAARDLRDAQGLSYSQLGSLIGLTPARAAAVVQYAEQEPTAPKRQGSTRADLLRELARELAEGKLRPGEKLPPVFEMARAYDLSTVTVGKTYKALAQAGLVEGRRGLGTFVVNSELIELKRLALALLEDL